MHNFIFAIFSSTSIALILKYNHTKSGNPIILLSGNYLVASLFSIFLAIINNEYLFEYKLALFGVMLGFLFVLSFFTFAKAVMHAGTPLATISSRLSVVVPIVLSLLLLSETPNQFQIIGIAFSILTIFLFYKSLSKQKLNLSMKSYLYLLSVLIGIGISDFGMKVFQFNFSLENKNMFLFYIFFSAYLFTIIIFLIKRSKFEKKTFINGMVLGVPNMLSSYFLIGALAEYKAIIVYPTVNIGIIITTTIAASLIWNEQLNNLGKLALIAGCISIALLSFN